MGSGIGGGSGRLESIEGPRRCSGRCPGGPAQMGEDHWQLRGIFDGGDDRQRATTLEAVLQVDIEHPFTKALPGFRPAGRRSPFKTAPSGFVSSRGQLMRAEVRQRDPLRSHWRNRCAWNDLGPELGVGREHAMEANAAGVGATGTLPAQSMDGCFT
jgi:hypothetical protein